MHRKLWASVSQEAEPPQLPAASLPSQLPPGWTLETLTGGRTRYWHEDTDTWSAEFPSWGEEAAAAENKAQEEAAASMKKQEEAAAAKALAQHKVRFLAAGPSLRTTDRTLAAAAPSWLDSGDSYRR